MTTNVQSNQQGNANPVTKVNGAVTQPTIEQLMARVAELESQQHSGPALSVKVSEKGAVQVNGLGRFPVTLYSSQMTKLLDFGPKIREFMAANVDKLAVKAKK